MKQRVVFLFYHGLGHINAFLRAGQILKNANYDVYFAGVGFFQRYISAQDFKFYLLKTYPFGTGLETWINTQKKEKYIFISSIRDRIKDRVYQDREVELYWMLEELKPSIVLIDAQQATDFIVLYKHLKSRSLAVAMVHTMLPTQVVSGRPPMNSDAFPDDKLAVKKAIRRMKWKQFKKRWKKRLMHLGFDDQVLISRRLKKNSIPPYYISKIPSLMNFAVNNVDEFILAPQAFDFPDFTPSPMQHYVGFMTTEIRNDQLLLNYKNISTKIFKQREDENLKLLYCSFGTIEPKAKGIVSSFLKRLVQATLDENYILVISLNSSQEEVAQFEAKKNVYIFQHVPQLEVLKQADLFITHGGLNSIKESVYAEVPMLLYPIHPEYDPNGNAARVAYHGLGLRGKAVSDTTDEIKAKIKELLFDPRFKQNVLELKNKDARYTAEIFLERLRAIKPLSVQLTSRAT